MHSLLPWQTFQCHCELAPADLLRLLQASIAPCCRRPDLLGNGQYFCGEIDVQRAMIRFTRNAHAKGRAICPRMSGTIRPHGDGSLVDVRVVPSPGFWLGMSPVAFLLLFPWLGLLAWVAGSIDATNLLGFVLILLVGVFMLSWLWVTLLVLHFFNLWRYREELHKLLTRLGERTADGAFIAELPPSPAQVERQKQQRAQSRQNALLVMAIAFLIFGLLLVGVGGKGLLTGEITFHAKHNRHRATYSERRITLTGAQGAAASQAVTALGLGLLLIGVVFGMLKRRAHTDGKWPPLETSLVVLAIILLVFALVQGIRSQS